jgi:hypothetical protein
MAELEVNGTQDRYKCVYAPLHTHIHNGGTLVQFRVIAYPLMFSQPVRIFLLARVQFAQSPLSISLLSSKLKAGSESD